MCMCRKAMPNPIPKTAGQIVSSHNKSFSRTNTDHVPELAHYPGPCSRSPCRTPCTARTCRRTGWLHWKLLIWRPAYTTRFIHILHIWRIQANETWLNKWGNECCVKPQSAIFQMYIYIHQLVIRLYGTNQWLRAPRKQQNKQRLTYRAHLPGSDSTPVFQTQIQNSPTSNQGFKTMASWSCNS